MLKFYFKNDIIENNPNRHSCLFIWTDDHKM